MGEEVVQLYIAERPGGPARRLLAFDKVALQPGETKRVSLTVDPRLLADYGVAGHCWRIAAGRYKVAIGSNAGKQVSAAEVVIAPRKWHPEDELAAKGGSQGRHLRVRLERLAAQAAGLRG